jgi:hypothetical protein
MNDFPSYRILPVVLSILHRTGWKHTYGETIELLLSAAPEIFYYESYKRISSEKKEY